MAELYTLPGPDWIPLLFTFGAAAVGLVFFGVGLATGALPWTPMNVTIVVVLAGGLIVFPYLMFIR